MLVDPTSTDPGSAEGRALGCICDPQPDAPVIGLFCPLCGWRSPDVREPDEWMLVSGCGWCGVDASRLRVRKRWDVEPVCPVHGIAALKAWVEAEVRGGPAR